VELPGLTEEDLKNTASVQEFVDKLLIKLEKPITAGIRYTARVIPASDGPYHGVGVTRQIHGLDHDKVFEPEFFSSAEYQMIANLGKQLQGLFGEGAIIQRGDKSLSVNRFSEVINWLFEEARKGLAIQRYKGLGEMNPDQLWETTMNPETRRMLQVRVEDAIAADEIFTTLMGDQVEPRRDFIERNALSAMNIDT